MQQKIENIEEKTTHYFRIIENWSSGFAKVLLNLFDHQ